MLPLLRRLGFRREAVQIIRVELYARIGEVVRARAIRGELTAPRSDLIEISLGSSEFADATIDRWVRLALELNNTTLTVALLARVIAARGDHELADHLAREARDRVFWCPLRASPALTPGRRSHHTGGPALEAEVLLVGDRNDLLLLSTAMTDSGHA